jgi:hypothetical protein
VTRTDAVKALHYEYVSRVHAAIGAQEQLRATWCSGATRCCCFDFYFLPQHTVHQRVASTLHRPYALPLPRVPRADDRPRPPAARGRGPAGLDRRPKEPPGARDGRRTAAGAAPAGRGTGLVPGCRHMLQTCYAITTLTTGQPRVCLRFRDRVTVPPQGSAVLARIRWKMQIKSI